MTRETKIGLLVGLAFIVVFAMLLSHSSPPPPPGDARQLVLARNDTASRFVPVAEPAASDSQPVAEPEVSSETAESPMEGRVEPPESTIDSPLVLPTPGILGPPVPSTPIIEDAAELAAAPSELSPNVLESTRQAPPLPPDPVPEPEATARTETPAQSPAPEESTPAAPAPSIPEPVAVPPKNYVVQKGDSLNVIAKAMYNTASPRVVDFLVKANRMKDKHVIIEGQKLIVPQLPADMFEPVTQLNVAKRDQTRLASNKLDELINTPRRAPLQTVKETSTALNVTGDSTTTENRTVEKTTSDSNTVEKIASEGTTGDKTTNTKTVVEKTVVDRTTKSGNSTRTSKTTSEVRVYEVKQNETFVSIARKQLGSSAAWKDIERLNKDVDPTRMKVGTKLKLPVKRQPVSQAAAAERNSA